MGTAPQFFCNMRVIYEAPRTFKGYRMFMSFNGRVIVGEPETRLRVPGTAPAWTAAQGVDGA